MFYFYNTNGKSSCQLTTQPHNICLSLLRQHSRSIMSLTSLDPCLISFALGNATACSRHCTTSLPSPLPFAGHTKASAFDVSIVDVCTIILVAYTASRVIAHFCLLKTQSYFSAENGTAFPRTWPHPDLFFGLDLLVRTIRGIKNGNYLHTETLGRYHEMQCWTYSYQLFGRKTISTAEPANIKWMLKLRAQDFELPKARQNAFFPLLGHGIFTSNGDIWKMSRTAIKPMFTEPRVHMTMFSTHIANLLSQLPSNGMTVDLQTLFFKLTIDTTTESLFGKSVSTLLFDDSTSE